MKNHEIITGSLYVVGEKDPMGLKAWLVRRGLWPSWLLGDEPLHTWRGAEFRVWAEGSLLSVQIVGENGPWQAPRLCIASSLIAVVDLAQFGTVDLPVPSDHMPLVMREGDSLTVAGAAA